MAFELFDHVRIEHKNVTGNIVDIYPGDDGQPVYTVQSSERGLMILLLIMAIFHYMTVGKIR
jgi:V8-like Glu-specific endopeptidase